MYEARITERKIGVSARLSNVPCFCLLFYNYVFIIRPITRNVQLKKMIRKDNCSSSPHFRNLILYFESRFKLQLISSVYGRHFS